MNSLLYLLREGFRSVWKNRFMAVASICVLVACILITGASYLTFANVNHIFDWVYSQNVVVVYVSQGSSESEVTALGTAISELSNVSNVEFMSRDDILEKYRDSFSDELFEQLQGENNPMQDAYIVTFRDLATFDATLSAIEALPNADSVSYSGDVAATLTRIRSVLLVAGTWVVLLLLVVSLFIIANTIKLTVYSRRLEIGIMKSVGATNLFIRLPFVVEGAVLGLLAGVLAFGATWLIYDKVAALFDGAFMGLLPFTSLWSGVLIAYVLGGILTGILGSAISMGRYLKDEGMTAFE